MAASVSHADCTMRPQQRQDGSHFKKCTRAALPRRALFRSLRIGSHHKPTTNHGRGPHVEEEEEPNSIRSLQLDE